MSPDHPPVDQMLPTPRLLALGLQHVLVMYAGGGRGSADHRAGAETAAEECRVPDQRRSVRPAGSPRWCNASAFPGSASGCR